MRRRNRNFALKLIPIHMRLSNYVLSKSTFFASKFTIFIFLSRISILNYDEILSNYILLLKIPNPIHRRLFQSNQIRHFLFMLNQQFPQLSNN